MDFLVSQQTIDKFKQLLRDVEKLKGALPPGVRKDLYGSHPQDEFFPNEVYMAVTPAGGIPKLSSSAGGNGGVSPPPPPLPLLAFATAAGGDKPGSAVCEIYKVQTDIAGTAYELLPNGHSRLVWNYSDTPIDGDCWILVVRDKYGNWWAVPPTTSSGQVIRTAVVLATFIESNPELCTGTGTDAGPDCPMQRHLARLQEWSADCGEWRDAGCIVLIDINSNMLQEGKRYPVWSIPWVENIGAISIPPTINCDAGLDEEQLWATDAGDPTRTFQITSFVVNVCDSEFTGTGTGTSLTSTVLSDSIPCFTNGLARIYTGKERRNKYLSDGTSCGYELVGQDVYLIESCGKELPSGVPLEGHYQTTIPRVWIEPGDTSGSCVPVYIVDCGVTGPDQYIISIECVPNTDGSGASPSICDPGIGDKVVRIADVYWMCGKLKKRVVREHTFTCCCEFNCFPGVSLINCAPCDGESPEDRPRCVNVSVDSNGDCPCIDGSYDGELLGLCYQNFNIEACGTRWGVSLCCIDGTWWASIHCGVCGFEENPDDPPPPVGCQASGVAVISSCNPFSGTATLGPIECQQGTCTRIETIDLTFTEC